MPATPSPTNSKNTNGNEKKSAHDLDTAKENYQQALSAYNAALAKSENALSTFKKSQKNKSEYESRIKGLNKDIEKLKAREPFEKILYLNKLGQFEIEKHHFKSFISDNAANPPENAYLRLFSIRKELSDELAEEIAYQTACGNSVDLYARIYTTRECVISGVDQNTQQSHLIAYAMCRAHAEAERERESLDQTSNSMTRAHDRISYNNALLETVAISESNALDEIEISAHLLEIAEVDLAAAKKALEIAENVFENTDKATDSHESEDSDSYGDWVLKPGMVEENSEQLPIEVAVEPIIYFTETTTTTTTTAVDGSIPTDFPSESHTIATSHFPVIDLVQRSGWQDYLSMTTATGSAAVIAGIYLMVYPEDAAIILESFGSKSNDFLENFF